MSDHFRTLYIVTIMKEEAKKLPLLDEHQLTMATVALAEFQGGSLEDAATTMLGWSTQGIREWLTIANVLDRVFPGEALTDDIADAILEAWTAAEIARTGMPLVKKGR